VVVEQFAATQSDEVYDAVTQSLEFPAGRYAMELTIEDENSGQTALREVSFVVRDLNGPVGVSDLIIIDSFDPAQNTISPNVSNRVSTEAESFRFFYEIYSRATADVRIVSEVIRMKQPAAERSVRSLFGLGEDDSFGDVAYVRPENTSLRRGRQAVVSEIPVSGLGAGKYLVRVSVEDENGTLLDRAQKVITAEWTGLAEHIQNLEEAIAQLQYIAKDRDVRYIREGRTDAEKMSRFREFWKKRDPTPSTDRNENMEEYYYRVSFANQKYGSLIAGWRTDRGNVLVRFGEPDFIERRPFNFDVEPYEVWYYYRLGKRFIFIDKTGLGDYELWVPIWDERNRIR
jgi:GWxTD domain-containing protein